MKKQLILTAVALVFFGTASAQVFKGNSCLAQFTPLKDRGDGITATINTGGTDIVTYSFESAGDGKTQAKAEFSGELFSKVVMNIYQQDILTRSIPLNRGPNPDEIIIEESLRLANSSDLEMDAYWWLLGAWVVDKVMDCWKSGKTTTTQVLDADGNVVSTTVVHESSHWDCGGQSASITVGGITYQNVSKVEFVGTTTRQIVDRGEDIYRFRTLGSARILSLR